MTEVIQVRWRDSPWVNDQRWRGGVKPSQVGTGRRSKRLARARNLGPQRLSGVGGCENHLRT